MEGIKLPSHFQINDRVDVDFQNTKHLKSCKVVGVRFVEGKVYYDIEVPVGSFEDTTVLRDVDSVLITSPPQDAEG